MDARTRRGAVAVIVVCAALSASAVGAGAAVGPERALRSHLVEDTVVALAWLLPLAARMRRGRPIAVEAVVAGAWALAAASNGGAAVADNAAGAVAAWVGTSAWGFAVGVSYAVTVVRATDPEHTRGLQAAGWAAAVGMAVSFAVLPTVEIGDGTAVLNPLTVPAAPVVAVVATAATAGLALVSIAVSVRRMTTRARRRRILPVVGAAAAGLGGIGVGAVATEWAPLVQALTVPLLPVALSVHVTVAYARRAAQDRLAAAADLIGTVRRTLDDLVRDHALEGVAVEVGGEIVAEVGRPGDRVWPLVHLGREEGQLRTSAVETAEEDDILALTGPIAAALASARLVDELRSSRAALARAGEVERRRVRRDLHDEVGPLLSAAAIQVDVAGLAVRDDPARAAESLRRARTAADEAIVALRRVVRGLRPAAIDELGLVGAVEAMTGRLGGSVAVRVVADRLPPTTAAVEVAAYRIVAEAVANAVRHAGAGTVSVMVAGYDGGLRVRVIDDGGGFDASRARAGVGLASMRQRAEEVGGTLEVASTPSGTVVEGRLPDAR